MELECFGLANRPLFPYTVQETAIDGHASHVMAIQTRRLLGRVAGTVSFQIERNTPFVPSSSIILTADQNQQSYNQQPLKYSHQISKYIHLGRPFTEVTVRSLSRTLLPALEIHVRFIFRVGGIIKVDS